MGGPAGCARGLETPKDDGEQGGEARSLVIDTSKVQDSAAGRFLCRRGIHSRAAPQGTPSLLSRSPFGLQRVTTEQTPLEDVVLYVRGGAILTLNRGAAGGTGAVPQHTAQLGGALDVHVYAGRDCVFTLYEDDGASLDYATRPGGAGRATTFTWTDATRTLAWTVADRGGARPNAYTTAVPTLFAANEPAPRGHAPIALGIAGGSVQWGA